MISSFYLDFLALCEMPFYDASLVLDLGEFSLWKQCYIINSKAQELRDGFLLMLLLFLGGGALELF